MSDENNIIYWLTLLRIPLSYAKILQLISKVSDVKAIFTLPTSFYEEAGLTLKQIAYFKQVDWSHAAEDMAWCYKNACHIIPFDHEAYPPLLKEIADPPLVLFVQGNVDCLSKPGLSIVGTRKPTFSGEDLAQEFAFKLAECGLVITSGLALGIDKKAHYGALLASSPTIGVLGHGFQHFYPEANRGIAEKIILRGALLTEFLPEAPPRAFHFPRRNRIISGLSLGVLVVEAALKSGSLITARLAAEQGREVFAIPGSIHNPQVRGCHYLIHQGAKLVERVEDVLEELGMSQTTRQGNCDIIKPIISQALDKKSQQLLAALDFEETPLDTIIARSGLTPSEVSSMLLSLELQGLLSSAQGRYRRVT